MSNLHSKQMKSVIARLFKRCVALYEKHPGAWLDPERAKQLTELEDRLHSGLKEAKSMIEMRRVEMDFFRDFSKICQNGQHVRDPDSQSSPSAGKG